MADGLDDAADLVNVALMVVSLFEQEGPPENGYVKIHAIIPADIYERLKRVCVLHGFGDALEEVRRMHQQDSQGDSGDWWSGMLQGDGGNVP